MKRYDYIATYVDAIIIVAQKPEEYLIKIKEIYPIRNIEYTPEYYLGNNLEVRKDKTLKVSLEKYITEILRQYESKTRDLRKENVPAKLENYPKCDDISFKDRDGIRKHQQIIGICQCINIAGRYDINYAVSYFSRFSSSHRDGHLKGAIKILGYLRQYKKRRYIVDPRDHICNFKYDDIVPDFGNQYFNFGSKSSTKSLW